MTQISSLYVVDDAAFDRHVPPASHPDKPARLAAARRGLGQTGYTPVQARPATEAELARAHDAEYLKKLFAWNGRTGEIAAETYVSPGSVDAALLAAGACIELAKKVQSAPNSIGFALLRPPGHHAVRAGAGGFCLLNNVAVAACELLQQGMSRVAIVDWDVHHGNGTQDIFYAEPRVYYISTHQAPPCYPGTGWSHETGEGAAQGTTLNLPMAPYSGDEDCKKIWLDRLLPALRAFRPEAILVSAGYDASERDPLAEMQFTPAAYAWMASQLLEVAREFTQGRLTLILEGGYDDDALEAGIAATLTGLGLSGLSPAFPFVPGETRATQQDPQL